MRTGDHFKYETPNTTAIVEFRGIGFDESYMRGNKLNKVYCFEFKSILRVITPNYRIGHKIRLSPVELSVWINGEASSIIKSVEDLY